MRILAFTFFLLMAASGATAAPDSEPKPSPAVCNERPRYFFDPL